IQQRSCLLILAPSWHGQKRCAGRQHAACKFFPGLCGKIATCELPNCYLQGMFSQTNGWAACRWFTGREYGTPLATHPKRKGGRMMRFVLAVALATGWLSSVAAAGEFFAPWTQNLFGTRFTGGPALVPAGSDAHMI